MKNMKFWRTALVAALVLTVMLSVTGGTIAWFTDEVTSSVNTIKAGNLDVALYNDKGEVGAATKLFEVPDLWEPGAVAYENLTIKNEGNLHLLFDLGINFDNVNTVAGTEYGLDDVLKVAVVEGAVSGDREAVLAAAQAAGGKALGDLVERQPLAPSATKTYGVVIYWEPSAEDNNWNLNNGKTTSNGAEYLTIDLGVKLEAIQATVEEDSFDNQYDAEAAAKIVADTQKALDNAKPGDVIKLVAGVNYGTLVVRPVLNADHTESGDWQTSNYRTELARTIKDVTILGASGAKVDAIVFDAGYKGSNYIDGAPDLMNYVNIQNLVIDGVEFSDSAADPGLGYNSPIYVNLQNTNVNGLTVKNCKLVGSNPKTNLVYIYGEMGNHTFATASKNVIITDNTVDGIARLCELRGTENVTITGNNVKNTAEHGVLLAGSGYSGNVVISNNTFDSVGSIGDVNVVRMAGADNANVTISNNTASNYLGGRADFAKVDGGSPVIENNTFVSIGVKDAAAAQKALDNAVAGTTIQLQSGVNYGTLVVRPVMGAAHTESGDWFTDNYRTELARTIENVTILGAVGAKVDRIKFDVGYKGNDYIDGVPDLMTYVNIKNLVIDGVEFTSNGVATGLGSTASIFVNLQYTNLDGLTVKNCKLTGATNSNNKFVYIYDDTNITTFATASKNVTLTNNTVDGVEVFAELRGTENVTITGNEIKNISSVGIILGVLQDNGYSGDVTITGNTFGNCAKGALDYVTSAMPATFSKADVIANNTGLTDDNVTGY